MIKILEYYCCFEIFENIQKKYHKSSHSFIQQTYSEKYI